MDTVREAVETLFFRDVHTELQHPVDARCSLKGWQEQS